MAKAKKAKKKRRKVLKHDGGRKRKKREANLLTLFPDYRKKAFLGKSTQETNQYVQELSEAYLHKGLVLYLGAGVSISIGLPSWLELIRSLTVMMMTRKVRSAIDSTKGLSEEKYWDAIRKIQQSFEKEADLERPTLVMARAIKDEFDTELPSMIAMFLYRRIWRWRYKFFKGQRKEEGKVRALSSELLDSVVKIARAVRDVHGVQAIVNYNFDDLVDEKLREENVMCKTVRSGRDKVPTGVLPCYHVHGVIPFSDFLERRKINRTATGNLVFSEDEYHKEYSDPYKWSNMTQVSLLGRYTGLFIGLSMEDPNLRRLIDVTHRQYPEIQNYAILPRKHLLSKSGDSNKTVQRNLFERVESTSFLKIGVRVIWVDGAEQIPKVIRNICTM